MKFLKTHQEFELLNRWTESNLPYSAILNSWLKVNLIRPDGFGTSENASCFVDRWPDPNLAIGIDQVPLQQLSHFPWFCMYANPKTVDLELMEKCLLEISREMDLTRIGGLGLRGVSDQWTPVCDRVFKNRLKLNATCPKWPGKMFCVPMDQQEKILAESIKIPDGFEFDVLKKDEVDIVNESWPHRFQGSRGLFLRRIRHFPNICLREKSGKSLASFELVDDMMGVVTNLYTMEEFRGKRLAKVVETALVQKMLKYGYFPVKIVLKGNESGMKLTERMECWTYIEESNTLGYGDKTLIDAFPSTNTD